jgi:hypothetical protein
MFRSDSSSTSTHVNLSVSLSSSVQYCEDIHVSSSVESMSPSSSCLKLNKHAHQVSDLNVGHPSLEQHMTLPKITKVSACKCEPDSVESAALTGPPEKNQSDCGTGHSKPYSTPPDLGDRQRTSSAPGARNRAIDDIRSRLLTPHTPPWFVHVCHETTDDHAMAALRNWAHTKHRNEITPDFLMIL